MKKSNLELILEFAKWFFETRKWQSRLFFAAILILVLKSDLKIIYLHFFG